ncbi:MAG: hypothetical protein RSD41_00380, partial [Kiritimatiellia bacterium]
GMVQFWVMDVVLEDSVYASRNKISSFAANLACLLLVTSLPGLYAGSSLTIGLWSFLFLPLCIVLQNSYALSGGSRGRMGLFGIVLGLSMVESPWILATLPIFFLRVITIEWRLWNGSVRNLSVWFLAFVTGVVMMLLGNAARLDVPFDLGHVWATEVQVLWTHLDVLMGLVSTTWLRDLLLGTGWMILAWITARGMLNNKRTWGLLFTAIVLTGISWAVLLMVRLTPMHEWFAIGEIPIGTAVGAAIVSAMLLVGWCVELFARNPTIQEYESTATLRVAAIAMLPLFVLVVIAAGVLQGRRFAAVDRGMANRFAAETVQELAPGDGLASNHVFLLGSPWIEDHLMLEAQAQGVPLTLFSPARMGDQAYLKVLRKRLETEPLLDSADRLRLIHLLDYNFFVFVQDFFMAQPNVAQIAVAYNLADIWYAAKLRPLTAGTVSVGLQDNTVPTIDPLPGQLALQARWAKTLEPKALRWWDLSASIHQDIRHHLAFMANNLGTFLDDQGRTKDAADCYYYASQTDRANISALLNLYDICIRRNQLTEKRLEIERDFEHFITATAKSNRQYDLSEVGRRFGYIRNYDLFVQRGWEWAVSAAPESVLAGLRTAQAGLAPSDPRVGVLQSMVGALYESQGQSERSFANYSAAVLADPKNIEAMRGLLRASIQSGRTAEAGKWLARAQEAGADEDSLSLDRSAYLMAMGDLNGARQAIATYTSKNKDSAIGWAMLGMLEVEQGHLDRASGYVMENIRRTAKNQDLYFVHILQGRLAQAREQWAEARSSYRHAHMIRPTIRGVLEIILELDRRLGDKRQAEVDALAILREDVTHPFANFVVGTQRLEDASVATAIKYFRVAVDASETVALDLLNNYADALARTDKTALAEEIAMRAVRLAPTHYTAWGTLAFAMARNQKSEKATTALEKARSLKGGNDPQLGLVDVWIAIDVGDRAAGEKALETLRVALGTRISPLNLADFKAAEAALAKLKK